MLVLLLLMLLVGFADKNAKNSAREAIGASTDLRALLLRCSCYVAVADAAGCAATLAALLLAALLVVAAVCVRP